MATIIIPTPLRKFTNQQTRIKVGGENIQQSINELISEFPDLKKNLLEDNGKIRNYVNIFIGNKDIRDLLNEHTLVEHDTVISIVPAIAGGSSNQL